MGKLVGLTGRRFGKLKVLEQGESVIEGSGNVRAAWVCVCDCGETETITSRYLLRGDRKCCHKCATKRRNREKDTSNNN